jgi:hypothetical protein
MRRAPHKFCVSFNPVTNKTAGLATPDGPGIMVQHPQINPVQPQRTESLPQNKTYCLATNPAPKVAFAV